MITAEQGLRKSEADEKWHRLVIVRKMFNCLLSDRNDKGRVRFSILYYISRWPYARGVRGEGENRVRSLHTFHSLVNEITWLEEKEILRLVRELVKNNWLQQVEGYLRLSPLGHLHFQHILVTEAEDYADDFLLLQLIENLENRRFLGTTNQSTITSFASALQILEGCRNKLLKVLNSLDPSSINEASNKAEIYLGHMRRLRNRIIELGILGDDDQMVQVSYNLLGEVGNLIQDVRQLKDKLEARQRGQIIVHYTPEELDNTILGMIGQSNIELAVEEFGNWLKGSGVNSLPLLLDTGSLIPALDYVHQKTIAMSQEDIAEEDYPQPTKREQKISPQRDMDTFIEDLMIRLQADLVLTTSKIVPHEKRGHTLLNLSRIKWLAGYSADLRRKYGGQVFKYKPLGIKKELPSFNIEFMDDAEIQIKIKENKEE